MTSRSKLWALSAGVLALSLVLAGCGGGSTARMMEEETTQPPPPTPAELAQAEYDNIVGLIGVARTAVNGLDEDSTDMEVAAADDAVMAAQDALDDAELISPMQTRDLDTALAGVQALLATAKMEIADRIAADEKDRLAGIAATTKAAMSKADEIKAEMDQTDDAGLGGDTARTITAGDEGSYTLAIGYDGGQVVTITVEGATTEADRPFTLNDMGMHVLENDADTDGNVVSEVAIVHTDIEAPTATPFADVHTLNVTTDTTNDTPDQTNEALAVDQSSESVLALVMSNAFAPGTSSLTQHTFAFDDTATMDMDEADEVAGTYDGAMGTYRCNGTAACTVTVNAMGMVTAMSAGWIFTPGEGATADVADADYLHYGFWLKKTEDADGATTYNEVETFAGSSVTATGSVGSVTGKATYEGGAAGVYVHETFATDGKSDATSGHFTADASLMATFGQVNDDNNEGTIPPNQLNKITGMIDNFVLSGGEANEWSVALKGDIDSGGTITNGEAGDDGSLSGTFHGPVGDHDNNAETPEIPYPHTVVGEFNANFINGSVAGAFGVREVKAE